MVSSLKSYISITQLTSISLSQSSLLLPFLSFLFPFLPLDMTKAFLSSIHPMLRVQMRIQKRIKPDTYIRVKALLSPVLFLTVLSGYLIPYSS